MKEVKPEFITNHEFKGDQNSPAELLEQVSLVYTSQRKVEELALRRYKFARLIKTDVSFDAELKTLQIRTQYQAGF